jgi:NADH-quinone oxidoreductase subunit N
VIPVNDLFTVLPALVLSIFGCALLLMRLDEAKLNVGFVVAGEALAAIALWRQNDYAGLLGFFGSVMLDQFGIFLNAVCLAGALLAALGAYLYLEREQEESAEFYALLLFAQAGMYLVISGVELMTVFIGLETTAVSFYVLTGFLRSKATANEAALKYLLLGAFSSALLLYGFSILYGLSGSTRFGNIIAAVGQRDASDPLILMAVVPIVVGLLFKVAAAPLHMWAPDAYEGAPTPISAYLATASKAASFALLLRMVLGPLAQFRSAWEGMVLFAALASLTVGNFGALTQQSVKRLLAYSSVAHAGYILLGLVAGNQTGLEGMLFYLLVYTFMTTGAFLVLAALPSDEIGSFRGLLFRSPILGGLMMILLVSLAGLPPTAGFLPKYQIFLSLIQTRNYWLAVVAALYVAVSLYYYFRIAREMVQEPEDGVAEIPMSTGWRAAVGTAAILSLGLGLNPQPAFEWARNALR